MANRNSRTETLHLAVMSTEELTPEEKHEIVALCSRAFDEDFSSLFVYCESSQHVLARLAGALVGHACWSTRWLQPGELAPLRTAYVDAVATEPAYQRRGLGSSVMQRLAAEVSGYELGGLSTERVSFYERLGWERWQGSLAIRTPGGLMPTPEESVLILRTVHTPPLDVRSLLTAEPRPGQPW